MRHSGPDPSGGRTHRVPEGLRGRPRRGRQGHVLPRQGARLPPIPRRAGRPCGAPPSSRRPPGHARGCRCCPGFWAGRGGVQLRAQRGHGGRDYNPQQATRRPATPAKDYESRRALQPSLIPSRAALPRCTLGLLVRPTDQHPPPASIGARGRPSKAAQPIAARACGVIQRAPSRGHRDSPLPTGLARPHRSQGCP